MEEVDNHGKCVTLQVRGYSGFNDGSLTRDSEERD